MGNHRNFTGETDPYVRKMAFAIHYNFYPKPKVDLDAEITPKIRQKLTDL